MKKRIILLLLGLIVLIVAAVLISHRFFPIRDGLVTSVDSPSPEERAPLVDGLVTAFDSSSPEGRALLTKCAEYFQSRFAEGYGTLQEPGQLFVAPNKSRFFFCNFKPELDLKTLHFLKENLESKKLEAYSPMNVEDPDPLIKDGNQLSGRFELESLTKNGELLLRIVYTEYLFDSVPSELPQITDPMPKSQIKEIKGKQVTIGYCESLDNFSQGCLRQETVESIKRNITPNAIGNLKSFYTGNKNALILAPYTDNTGGPVVWSVPLDTQQKPQVVMISRADHGIYRMKEVNRVTNPKNDRSIVELYWGDETSNSQKLVLWDRKNGTVQPLATLRDSSYLIDKHNEDALEILFLGSSTAGFSNGYLKVTFGELSAKSCESTETWKWIKQNNALLSHFQIHDDGSVKLTKCMPGKDPYPKSDAPAFLDYGAN